MAELDPGEVIHQEVTEAARRFGLSPAVAADFALSVEHGFRERCGGDTVYIATNGKDSRNGYIFAEFSEGKSVKNISKQYGITRQQVFRILKTFGVSWETKG